MADSAAALHLRSYLQIAWLWIRAAWQYPTSFVLLAVGNGLITALDFVGLWIMFAHLDDLAGFTLPEVALLYGSASLALAVADTAIGSVVNLAARLCASASDSEILVDATAAEAVKDKRHVHPIGMRLIKGYDEEFLVYCVGFTQRPQAS